MNILFFKLIAITQALLLTALTVHNIHLERKLNGNSLFVFPLPEDKTNLKSSPLPITSSPDDILRNSAIQNLSDSINDGPDPSLFGPMRES